MSTGSERQPTNRPVPRNRAQRREHTMRELVSVARSRFAANGYAAVSLDDIVGAAGVTKGALYHHFGSKAGLFRAVVREVQNDVAERVRVAAEAESSPWRQLVTGCESFLRASRDGDVRQIMMIDGPAVLGWTEWRAMDEASSARHLHDVLETLVADGTIAPQPVAPLAHLLSGAMNEAALWLAGSDRERDLADTMAALSRMLDALRR